MSIFWVAASPGASQADLGVPPSHPVDCHSDFVFETGHKTFGGIDGFVSARCQRCLVTHVLQIAFRRPSHIIVCSYHELRGFERSLYRKWRDSLHDVIGYRLVDPYSSDSYALSHAVC